jgi:hypothetical protein
MIIHCEMNHSQARARVAGNIYVKTELTKSPTRLCFVTCEHDPSFVGILQVITFATVSSDNSIEREGDGFSKGIRENKN